MKRGWLLVAAATAMLGLTLAGPLLARRAEFFAVRRVEFVGLEFLSPRALAAELAIPRRASTFDDLKPIERRAARIQGVAHAEVGRRLPGTLVVRIREYRPVALAVRGPRLVLMDSAGRVLPYDPARSAPDLPVASRPDPRIGALLHRARIVDPALFARIETADRVGDDVVLVIDGRRALFRPDASAQEMRAVTAVAQDLVRLGQRYTELDGRYAGYVVVRGTGA